MPLAQPSRVVIVNDASVARGGATGLAMLSARLLRDRGIPVTFVAGDAGAAPGLREIGVEVVAVGRAALLAQRPLSAAVRGLHNAHAAEVVARWIEENDSAETVYHLHGWSKILSPAVFRPLTAVASRTIVHAHDFFLACPNGGFMDYPRRQPCARRPLGPACLTTNCDKRSYAQKLWRVARQVRVNGHLHAARWASLVMIHERMATYFTHPGFARQNLVTVRNPATALSSERIRAEDNRSIAFIGRLEPEKGVEEAIAAAAAAGMPMTVIGDGPLLPTLSRRFPQITFAGWCNREQIAGWLQQARVVVMPTRYPEPFGLVAAEAVLSGVPVVLSRSAFLGAEVATHDVGLVCDTGDPAAFAAALVRIRDMPPAVFAKISRRGAADVARLANTEHSWIGALCDLYLQALDSRNVRREAPS